MLGWQASGAAPIVRGEPVLHPETLATAIQIGNPASWQGAVAARDESGGHIGEVTDAQIIEAYRMLAAEEGCFVEPASAASVAGLLQAAADGLLAADDVAVCTVTGHGLKDPEPRHRRGAGRRPGRRQRRDGRRRAGPRVSASRSSPARRRASGAPSRSGSPVAATTSCSSPATARASSELAAELTAAHGVGVEVLAADLLDRRRRRRGGRARLGDADHPVDILVNNAGFGTYGRFAELDVDARGGGGRAQRRRAAAPHPRRARRDGTAPARRDPQRRVARRVPAATRSSATYGATKAFVHSFTHAVREEARGTGVHVMLVCPGYTHTEFHDRAGLGPSDMPEFVWQSADVVVAAALRDLDRGRSVSIPGVLNQTAAALSSVAPAGITRRVAGLVVKRSGWP